MAETSPLLGLPAELRNNIYRLSLVNDDPIDVTGEKSPREPALLTTCTQIRSEALATYYSGNRFLMCHRIVALKGDGNHHLSWPAWLVSLSSQTRKLVKAVIMKFSLELSEHTLDRKLTEDRFVWERRFLERPEIRGMFRRFALNHLETLLDLGIEPCMVSYQAPVCPSTLIETRMVMYKTMAEKVKAEMIAARCKEHEG